MPKAAISIVDLEKSFPPARSGWGAFLQPFERPVVRALAGISFEVLPGEAVALLGANGAGKSTLLRILATLVLPTKGRAQVVGSDVLQHPRDVRRELGYHSGNELGFYARLTAYENLCFFGALNQLASAGTAKRIGELAIQFQLEEAMNRQVRTLSSGTVQRLSLARALLHQPHVLLLDEPTRSLDAIGAVEFRRYLKTEVLRRGETSVLFASHALSEIEQIADRIAVLDRGQVVAIGSLSELKRRTETDSLEKAFFSLTGHSHELLSQERQE
ncbi:MAG TPA: ABC transporter ATP-binding protein [Candidatus Acidoferrum sp.]|nr:ABC transporter ATP-binding protein [Candidatus Acidoferrum sp.]